MNKYVIKIKTVPGRKSGAQINKIILKTEFSLHEIRPCLDFCINRWYEENIISVDIFTKEDTLDDNTDFFSSLTELMGYGFIERDDIFRIANCMTQKIYKKTKKQFEKESPGDNSLPESLADLIKEIMIKNIIE